MEHRLDPGRGDLEHRALAARAPPRSCAVEISVDALNQCGLWHASVGSAREGIEHRLESARCDLEHRALAARASANRSAVEIAIGRLNQRGLRLAAIRSAREGIEDRLDPGRRDLEYGSFVARAP